MSVIAGKKMFCLLTDEIICSYANKVSNRNRTQLKNGFLVFFYRNVTVYFVSQDFGRSTSEKNK